MTITLRPQMEALLKEQAWRLEQDADVLADTLLQSALEEAARDYEETVEGIRSGLEAAAGDETPFEEYVAQEREKRRQRDAARATPIVAEAA